VKWVLLAIVLLILLAAFALPGVYSSQRASNERSASASLKTIASAEADFRGNDRDMNGVQDFWTGDVAGLEAFSQMAPNVAEADASPIQPLVPKPRPKAGYFYEAMDLDKSAPPEERGYRKDTDGSGRKVHNHSRFGFTAYPSQPGKSGDYTFLINEGNTIFRMRNGGQPRRAWPEDSELRNEYSGGGED
jgi:type II secretory pathway pseudopilin PulG